MGDKDVILNCFTRFLHNLKTRNIFSPAIHTHTKSSVGLGNVDNKSSATIRNEITNANITKALGYTPQVGGVKLLWTGLFNATSTTVLNINIPDACLFNNKKSAIFIITRLPYNYQSNISSMDPIFISFDLNTSGTSQIYDALSGYYFSYSSINTDFNEIKYGVNSYSSEFFKMRAQLYLSDGSSMDMLKILGNDNDISYTGKYYITSVSALILG